MGFYGDPAELGDLSRRMEAYADDIRRAATALWSRSRQVQWESSAAERFRAAIDDDVAALRRAADGLDGATRALAQHTEAIAERVERIQAIQRAVTQWFQEQLRALDRLADGAADALSQVAKDPPWAAWPWRPGNLPEPGEKAWLEVGEFVKRRGIFS